MIFRHYLRRCIYCKILSRWLTDIACKRPTNLSIFHDIASMTFDVIKKRIRNFPSGCALNGRQKTLLGSAFQRLRFPYLLPLPAVSSPLVSRALDPLYPSTNVEQIIWGDQKIWSGELAAQTLTRDNDLRCYYGLKIHTNVRRWYIYCKILRQKLTA